MEQPKQLYQPEQLQSYEQFTEGTVSNIKTVFDMDTKSQELSLQNFLENKDHGLEHEYNVYQKAIQIAERYEKETEKEIRKHMIYPMAIVHDSMRSIQYDLSDLHWGISWDEIKEQEERNKQKTRREKRNDRNHERYGAFLFEKMLQSLEKKDIFVNLSEEEQQEIKEYLINHDYLSQQLNGGRFHEPKTIEWQIVRLADRISVPLQDEIQRYRDTGKRLNTPFFNESMPLEEREKFSFDKMPLYFKNRWVDEVLFFTSILMTTEKDFSDPILWKMYAEWAVDKDNAVDFIMEIGTKEWATPKQMQDLKILLSHLGKKFNFHVKE